MTKTARSSFITLPFQPKISTVKSKLTVSIAPEATRLPTKRRSSESTPLSQLLLSGKDNRRHPSHTVTDGSRPMGKIIKRQINCVIDYRSQHTKDKVYDRRTVFFIQGFQFFVHSFSSFTSSKILYRNLVLFL